MSDIRIGVIGGSGLSTWRGWVREERRIETPFGDPSDAYVIGELDGRAWPSCRATAAAIGCSPASSTTAPTSTASRCWASSRSSRSRAVGSLKIEYQPSDIVVPDQFFDRTRHRTDTFFGRGLVAHVSLAKPVCPRLSTRGGRRARRRRHRPWRRHLRLHGRAAVLDARRVRALPLLGGGHHRHDQPARRPSSPARPRSATRRSRWSPTTTAGTRRKRRSPAWG